MTPNPTPLDLDALESTAAITGYVPGPEAILLIDEVRRLRASQPTPPPAAAADAARTVCPHGNEHSCLFCAQDHIQALQIAIRTLQAELAEARRAPAPTEVREAVARECCRIYYLARGNDRATLFDEIDEDIREDFRRDADRILALLSTLVPQASRPKLEIAEPKVPDGYRRVEAYTDYKTVVVMGGPYMVVEDGENHNCDAMGCGSHGHVIARLPILPAVPQASQTEGAPTLDAAFKAGYKAGHEDGIDKTGFCIETALAEWWAKAGAPEMVTCPRCDGGGLIIDMGGDPSDCPKCGMAGVVEFKSEEGPRPSGVEASPLTWSKDRPTVDGFYWLRHELSEACIVEVSEIAGVWYVFDTEHTEQNLRKFGHEYQWAGPIPEPTEAQPRSAERAEGPTLPGPVGGVEGSQA